VENLIQENQIFGSRHHPAVKQSFNGPLQEPTKAVGGGPAIQPDFVDAVKGLRVLEAARRSAASNTTVHVRSSA
jgi:predicted dehydrogenase